VRSVFNDEKKLSIAALPQTLPERRWALARHPSSFIKLGPMAESRLYRIAHLQSFAI
jgi:hypothetical protein